MFYETAVLCDWFGAKRAAERLFVRAPRSDYAAWWGAVSLLQAGKDDDALRLLVRLHALHPAWKRTKRLLATLFLRTDPDQALRLYMPPTDIWEELTLGDLLYFFLHREKEGAEWWKKAYGEVDWETARSQENPARLLLKRLCRISEDPALLERFAELDTDNFRQAEIVRYAELLAGRGDRKQAREMLDRGFYIYRQDAKLSACWQKLGLGDLPSYAARRPGVVAVRHNISTGLLTETTDLAALIEQVHREYPRGIVTIASSVITMCEGTLLWTGTFQPSRLARFLGPYTGHGAGAFTHWYTYPREAAWKVQAYLELAGTFRVLLGAALAVAGKLVHRKGWFYDVVGPVAKAVDSDKVMPYDACLVPGPLNVAASLRRLARCGAEVSVVDVNDLYGAEIIASTGGVDEAWLKQALEDNPAGNDDSLTPIVVVMPPE